jgi:hypothetical protein
MLIDKPPRHATIENASTRAEIDNNCAAAV